MKNKSEIKINQQIIHMLSVDNMKRELEFRILECDVRRANTYREIREFEEKYRVKMTDNTFKGLEKIRAMGVKNTFSKEEKEECYGPGC
jgi:hypothetical protein